MKKLFVMVVMATCLSEVSAQTFSWAKREGLWAYDYGYGIANDNAGNVYVAGKYEQNAKFSGVTLPCQGNHDIYVAKYSASGSLIWIRTAGGYTGDYARGLACDGNYLYVVGEIEGANTTVQFVGSPITITCKGDNDIFVAKYDLNGNVLWAKRAGDSYNDKGYGVTYDQYGNVFICGFFKNKAVFGSITLTGSGDYDIFVAKLDPNGNFVWARKAGSSTRDEAKSIKCDAAGNVYVCGMYHNGAVFGSQTLTAPDGGFNGFLAKYSNSGTLLWVKKQGGNGDDVSWALTIDAAGRIILGGEFKSTVQFGSTQLNNSGAADAFITAYDAAGNNLWAKKAGGGGSDRVRGIGTDGTYIYATGQFGSTATFGSSTKTAIDHSDIFISCLSSTGSFLWTSTVGGAKDAAEDVGYESGNAVCAETSGNVYLTGALLSGGTFGGTSLSAYSRTDMFITKLKNNLRMQEPAEITNLPVLNAYLQEKSAQLYWSYVELNGATIALERSRNGEEYSIIAEPSADEAGMYRVADEFTAGAAKLYYRLRLTLSSGDQLYSEPVELKLATTEQEKIVFLSPNPAENELKVELASDAAAETTFLVFVYDMSGKQVASSRIANGAFLDISTLKPGTYFLQMAGEKAIHQQRFIKQ